MILNILPNSLGILIKYILSPTARGQRKTLKTDARNLIMKTFGLNVQGNCDASWGYPRLWGTLLPPTLSMRKSLPTRDQLPNSTGHGQHKTLLSRPPQAPLPFSLQVSDGHTAILEPSKHPPGVFRPWSTEQSLNSDSFLLKKQYKANYCSV